MAINPRVFKRQGHINYTDLARVEYSSQQPRFLSISLSTYRTVESVSIPTVPEIRLRIVEDAACPED